MTAYLYSGVDPGWTGALGFLEDIEGQEVAEVHDMPVREQGNHKRVDRPRVKGIIRGYGDRRIVAAVERVGTRPKEDKDPITGKKISRKEGAAGMVRFGQGQGEVLGVLEGEDAHIFEPPPAIWKMKCGLVGMSEREVCQLAAKLFPGLVFFGPKKGPLHGRAEAMFLAAFARMMVEGREIHDRNR